MEFGPHRFLIAVLQLDRILVERTAAKILKALQSLPTRLEEAYKENLLRIQNQAEPDNTLGMRILQWVSHSKRLLLVDELRHALAVEWEADKDPPRNLGFNDLLDPESLIDVCGGLVIIENESQIIRLVHFTTQEYFLRSPKSLFPESLFSDEPPDADTHISKTCLAYLSFDVFGGGLCTSNAELKAHLQLYPFLNYAALHWAYHLRGNPEQHLVRIALDFLNCPTNLIASTQIMNMSNHQNGRYDEPFSKSMTGLHVASIFGLQGLVAKLLFEGCAEINSEDSSGRKPLCWATSRGHDAVVKLLLEGGAEVDSRDSQRKTPLSWAASNGHDAVAKVLLEGGAEVDSKDSNSNTPLSWAALSGHDAVAKALLEGGPR